MSGQAPTPEQFVADWKGRDLSERESAQTHFTQLCRLLAVPAPYDNRADDKDYRFDAVTRTAGSHAYAAARRRKPRHAAGPSLFPDEASAGLPGSSGRSAATQPLAPDASPALSEIVSAPPNTRGFADVWKRACFCWEYKRQGQANLSAALDQLKKYRDSLDNPPLLIVCDVDNFEIHTNFTGYPSEVYRFSLSDLAEPSPHWREKLGISPLNALRKAFDPKEVEWFRPKKRVNTITEERAEKIAALADKLRELKRPDGQKNDAHDVAHFLMQIVFSMFAEDTDLLPRDLVTNLIRSTVTDPKRFTSQIRQLFEQMEKGGDFGPFPIDHFNGGLFRNVASQTIPHIPPGHLGTLSIVAGDDWSGIEPSILGTLFERALNPEKRSQIGAHYTSRDDIMLIIGPVILDPLRKEWQATQRSIADLIAKRDAARSPAARNDRQSDIDRALRAFHSRLSSLTILDPACGSGNFLYVAIQCLLDLEKQVLVFAAREDVKVPLKPAVSPTQLRGIEINDYAAELARISIWIGFLKWKRENGLQDESRPILAPLDTIECRDAILDRSNPRLPTAATWPKVDFIIGNPPFLGTKMLRAGLGDDYVETLFNVYSDRIPGFSDLCCYWFELAREQIERNPSTRAGLLATQAIRNGEARRVLERIKETGDIFMAWSDRPWVLDGAAVQVSMIGFDSDAPTVRTLNGREVDSINVDLSSGTDLTTIRQIPENANIGFVGDVKGGPFDIEFSEALALLSHSGPNGRPQTEVVRPYTNGLDVTRRNRATWVIDFGSEMSQPDAAAYGAPFDLVERLVKPARSKGRPTRNEWWLHMRPCPSMRQAVEPLPRYVATPTLTKHRLFIWMSGATLPDHQLVIFARADDYFFGVLHSSLHETWARSTGTQLREAESGFRYTPTSTFETFPLPWPPGHEPTTPAKPHHALWKSISTAASELDTLRETWLNPPEWIAEVEKKVDIKYRAELAAVPADSRSLVRRSAVMAEAAQDKRVKVRTLTNLYNERPAWLRLAHEKLDRAVLAAYAAVDPKGKWNPDWAAAYEPFGAGEITIKEKGKGADPPELTARKRESIAQRERTDALILAALLRLNHERANAEKSRAKKSGPPRKQKRSKA